MHLAELSVENREIYLLKIVKFVYCFKLKKKLPKYKNFTKNKKFSKL